MWALLKPIRLPLRGLVPRHGPLALDMAYLWLLSLASFFGGGVVSPLG